MARTAAAAAGPAVVVAVWVVVSVGTVAAAAAAMVEGNSQISLQVRESGVRQFVDGDGRERFFHGMNTVVKGPPWIPQPFEFDPDVSVSRKDVLVLRELGLNMIRLGVMWPGAAPTADGFNQTYFDEVHRIVKICAEEGIYVLLDMHQDVISEAMCGEGIPKWAVDLGVPDEVQKTFPEPLGPAFDDWDENGFPSRQSCAQYEWGALYGANATGKTFDALYNDDATFSAWSAFWTEVARQFKDVPNVLGVELINEPWAGDIYEDPALLVPSVADAQNLQPAYDRLAEAIHEVDPNVLVFFAAVTWDDPAKAGFDHAPNYENDRSVFAFHFYEPPQFTLHPYFERRVADADRLNTGVMLTETSRGVDTTTRRNTFSQADAEMLSWSLWELKSFCKETEETESSTSQNAAYGACKTGYGGDLWNEDGTLDEDVATSYARTYPHAVAGQTQAYAFDANTGLFELSYLVDTSIDTPTEVYCSRERVYTPTLGLPRVHITPADAASYEWNGNMLQVTAAPGVADGTEIKLRVSRAVL